MKRFTHGKSIYLLLLITMLYSLGIVSLARAQTQAMKAAIYNYEHFTKQRVFVDEEIKRQNKGSENHPELGMLYAETPCTDCYEILGKRTETTKTYSKLGSEGRHIWVQSSTDPLHYKDADGRWFTIQSELVPENQTGLFTSKAALVPITVNAHEGLVQLGKAGHRIQVNRQLELIFVGVSGREQPLGNADWSNYTAGDNGMYVKDIWPGIDMEITVYRGAAKTNFIIKKPIPAYANGQLIIRDRLNADKGLALEWPKETQWSGPFAFRDIAGRIAYTVHGAVAYEKNTPTSSLKTLQYGRSAHDELDIFIPGNWLDRTASSYPVVIDPLVQSSSQVIVAGSSYTPNLSTGGCPTLNPATVPADVTVTDIKWTFTYIAISPALKRNGATTFTMGTCRSPSVPGSIWTCAIDYLPGACQGIDISIYNDLKSCIPPPQCQPYDLNITMNFARNVFNNGISCSNDSIISGTPYIITVEGVTLEPKVISVSAPNATICEGDSTDLDATPIYGVGPYSYVWTPGGMTGSPIKVKPTVTTTYYVEITDQCNRVAHDTVEVFVTPSDNPGFTLDTNEICADKPVHATGLGNGQLSYYSWEATGSSNPSSGNSKTWTGSYPDEGVHDITMFYQSGNCKFPVTQQVTVYPVVNTVQYDTICDGEIYDFYGTQYTRSGTYNHHYISVHGCDSTRILYLTVNPIPPTPIPSGNTPVCVGDELQLRASDIFGVAYQWNGPGGFNSTARDPKISNVSFGAAGNYEITSTMKNCTSPPGILNVVVKPLPAASLQADKTDICSGDSVRFETVDYPGNRYQWAPDYYMLTNGEAVAYASVRDPGFIHVKVTDTGYCVNADSIYIETHPCCELFLPSAFTPNQDGKNDLYRVVTNGYQRIGAFRIVNRYGETVFDTGDQNRGWDGTYKGKPQAAGVYHYYIKYTCADGGFYEQKGDLTLIR